MAFTMQSTMGEILSNPEAVKIMDEIIPGSSKNPMLKMAKGFTVEKVAKTPAAKVSMETAEALVKALNEKLG